MPDDINESELFDEDEEYNFEDLFADDENSEKSSKDDEYRKLVEQAKKEAEEMVVEALVKGDTNSPIYKGLQKHLNARDKKIRELESALANAIQELQSKQMAASNEIEFLSKILPEMIDEKDREIFNNRRTTFMTEKKASALEEILKNRNQPPVYRQETEDDDFQEKVAEYIKMAEDQLREIAEISGVDPDDKRLNYGNKEEPLVRRLSAFKESISVIKKEDSEINSVREKKKVMTRTRGDSANPNISYGDELISRGMKQILERMRN